VHRIVHGEAEADVEHDHRRRVECPAAEHDHRGDHGEWKHVGHEAHDAGERRAKGEGEDRADHRHLQQKTRAEIAHELADIAGRHDRHARERELKAGPLGRQPRESGFDVGVNALERAGAEVAHAGPHDRHPRRGIDHLAEVSGIEPAAGPLGHGRDHGRQRHRRGQPAIGFERPVSRGERIDHGGVAPGDPVRPAHEHVDARGAAEVAVDTRQRPRRRGSMRQRIGDAIVGIEPKADQGQDRSGRAADRGDRAGMPQ